jgi:hypothetical protein
MAGGKAELSLPILVKCLSPMILGECHPDFAISLTNAVALYWKIGEYAAAEPLYKQALEIIRDVKGEQHPDFGLSLNNLAVL